jgi:peroxiredoxin
MKKVLKITFTLIPQPNRKVAENYGVWDRYSDHAIATIIVDKNGVIRFKKVGEGSRPTVSKIIKELQNI